MVVKFHSFKDRQSVWNKRRLLKNTGLFLEEHFALSVQQEHSQLLPFLQSARHRGEKATMIGNKLLIAGQRFSASQQDIRSLQLRYNENIKDRSQKELSTDAGPAIGFYGWFSELSNFFLSPVKVGDRVFPTVEHYYTTRKAEINSQPDLAYRVKTAVSPLAANIITKQLTMDPEIKLEVMKIGLVAKFQVPEMKKALLATGNKVLLEAAARDPFWGCGCTMSSKEILHKDNWKENHMGKLLMGICTDLQKDNGC